MFPFEGCDKRLPVLDPSHIILIFPMFLLERAVSRVILRQRRDFSHQRLGLETVTLSGAETQSKIKLILINK